MNSVAHPSPSAPRPAGARTATSTTHPVATTASTSFGQVPALTVTVSPQAVAQRLRHRALATSRRGYDHSWIGAFALATALIFAGACPVSAAAPMDNWTKPTQNAAALKSINDLGFFHGQFWAVGATGQVEHSVDGANWTVVQTPATNHLLSLAYGNGRFVAVGYNYTIMSSPDGTTGWTVHEQDPASGFGAYNQVRFLDGKFVVVGGQGRVRLSSNGTDWTPATMSGSSFYPNQVAWGNGTFVAVGGLDGSYTVQTSPDAVTWTRRSSTTVAGDLESVGFFNGLFVCGGESVMATSPDGVTWTKLTTIPWQYTNITVYGIAPANGRMFAWGEYGVLLSSPDGIDWTKHTTGTSLSFAGLAYNGDRLLMFRFGAVTSGNGPVLSDPWAPVAAEPDPVDPNAKANIANISTRAWVGLDDTKLITGFIVAGTTPKTVLVRAVGPTLAGYGVEGTLVDPRVTLFDGAGGEIANNDNWGTFADQAALATASAHVSAFPLETDSKDAAMLVTLPPGSYTIHTAGADGGTGVALAEVYDCESGTPCKLVNISSRGFIGTGDSVGIPGFVVSGNRSKKLLVRGVGPTLANWNVPATLADPRITLYSGPDIVAENNDWSAFPDQAALAAASAQVSAFPLNDDSKDAAMIVTVPPGLYTAVITGEGTSTGVALIEVYEIE